MDIESIQKKFKFLIIDLETSNVIVFKSNRQVSKYLTDIYNINLSHMYIRRHLQDSSYILKETILIKKLWE